MKSDNMKKKDTPFLDFYKECMETGFMYERPNSPTEGGLCSSPIGTHPVFELLHPTQDDVTQFRLCSTGYWASESDLFVAHSIRSHFNTLRQTIVLFCAAINEEY